MDRDPKDMLPLTPATFHVMLAMLDGAGHGYGIMREVGRLTNGEVQLGPATLYRSIQKMVVDGLIAELPTESGPESDERRRTYELTPFGRRVAEKEADRLADLVQAAARRGLLKGRSRKKAIRRTEGGRP
jgi:DNA-binding PadR family transcriptional regulator